MATHRGRSFDKEAVGGTLGRAALVDANFRARLADVYQQIVAHRATKLPRRMQASISSRHLEREAVLRGAQAGVTCAHASRCGYTVSVLLAEPLCRISCARYCRVGAPIGRDLSDRFGGAALPDVLVALSACEHPGERAHTSTMPTMRKASDSVVRRSSSVDMTASIPPRPLVARVYVGGCRRFGLRQRAESAVTISAGS
jgi:hypothetical protein